MYHAIIKTGHADNVTLSFKRL